MVIKQNKYMCTGISSKTHIMSCLIRQVYSLTLYLKFSLPSKLDKLVYYKFSTCFQLRFQKYLDAHGIQTPTPTQKNKVGLGMELPV